MAENPQKSYSTVSTNIIPSSMITLPRVELSPVAGQLYQGSLPPRSKHLTLVCLGQANVEPNLTRFQVAGVGQLIDHFISGCGRYRNFGCFFDGDQPVAQCSSVHEDEQGVVSR